jgi:hypothetical protein
MNKIISIIITVFSVIHLNAQKTLLTEKIINDLKANNIDIGKIQVYNNNWFIIEQSNTNANTEVISGKVKIESGSETDRVKFAKNTPGICRKIIGDTLFVDFEGDEKKLLKFVLSNTYYSKSKVTRLIGIGEYKRTLLKGTGKAVNKTEIIYGNTKCDLFQIANVRLTLKKSVIRKNTIKKRKAKGVRVE